DPGHSLYGRRRWWLLPLEGVAVLPGQSHEYLAWDRSRAFGPDARQSRSLIAFVARGLLNVPSNCRGRIDPGPKVHRAQLLAAAGLEVQKQLRAVCGATTKHQIDDEGPACGLTAEHGDLFAEVGVRHVAQERRVGIFVRAERRDCLIEVPGRGSFLLYSPRSRIERTCLGKPHECGPHRGEVLQQL